MCTSDKVFFCIGIGALIFTILHHAVAHAKDVRVMVIDTGIDASHLQLLKYVEAGSYEDLHDDHGHGTHIAGIISESGCPNLKIVSCKAFYKGHAVLERVHDCLNIALKSKIDIINYSGGGVTPDDKEYQLLKQLGDKGVKINVAAGNESKDLGSPCFGYFPACDNITNLTPVGSIDNSNNRSSFSDYGIVGIKWEYGEKILSTLPDNKYGKISGTSQATANYTKHMVQEMCYK